jgi:hypothetical protein
MYTQLAGKTEGHVHAWDACVKADARRTLKHTLENRV